MRLGVIGTLAVSLALASAVGACGTNTTDRTASGAGVGAATGAGIGALFGGIGALPGALIGAAVGAGGGYVTDAEDINLGEPVWRR